MFRLCIEYECIEVVEDLGEQRSKAFLEALMAAFSEGEGGGEGGCGASKPAKASSMS